jgi:hypothetical protein
LNRPRCAGRRPTFPPGMLKGKKSRFSRHWFGSAANHLRVRDQVDGCTIVTEKGNVHAFECLVKSQEVGSDSFGSIPGVCCRRVYGLVRINPRRRYGHGAVSHDTISR